MKDKIVNFITNQFVWYNVVALLSACLAGYHIAQGNDILALVWGIISVIDIVLAYNYRDI